MVRLVFAGVGCAAAPIGAAVEAVNPVQAEGKAEHVEDYMARIVRPIMDGQGESPEFRPAGLSERDPDDPPRLG